MPGFCGEDSALCRSGCFDIKLVCDGWKHCLPISDEQCGMDFD